MGASTPLSASICGARLVVAALRHTPRMKLRPGIALLLLVAIGASAVAAAMSKGATLDEILSVRTLGALATVAVAAGFVALFLRDENRDSRMNIARDRQAAHGRFVLKAGCLVVAAGLLASVLSLLLRR